MKSIILRHLDSSHLQMEYAGNIYLVQPATKRVRKLCKNLKAAAGEALSGRTSAGGSKLIINSNTADLIPLALSNAYQEMISDGLSDEEVKSLGVIAFHFHATGFTGALRVAAQYNKRAGA